VKSDDKRRISEKQLQVWKIGSSVIDRLVIP